MCANLCLELSARPGAEAVVLGDGAVPYQVPPVGGGGGGGGEEDECEVGEEVEEGEEEEGKPEEDGEVEGAEGGGVVEDVAGAEGVLQTHLGIR